MDSNNKISFILSQEGKPTKIQINVSSQTSQYLSFMHRGHLTDYYYSIKFQVCVQFAGAVLYFHLLPQCLMVSQQKRNKYEKYDSNVGLTYKYK